MNLVQRLLAVVTWRPPPLREPRLPSREEGQRIDAKQRELARELAYLRQIAADGDVFRLEQREDR